MKRNLSLALAFAVTLGLASAAEAQVFVRTPFVRVQVGGGVFVRAPFVNVYVPPRPYIYAPPLAYSDYYDYYAPRSSYYSSPGYSTPSYVAPAPTPVPAGLAPRVVEPPLQPQAPPPAPPGNDQPTTTQTLEQFAKRFQPEGGTYEATIANPVTGQPTVVRFTLPEGTPRDVHLRRNEIEFEYGFRRFVRIEFDNEGAVVTSR